MLLNIIQQMWSFAINFLWKVVQLSVEKSENTFLSF